MPVKYTKSSTLIDSPFAKMLQGQPLAPLLGLPPVATDMQVASRPEYITAAEMLGLFAPDQSYVASLIRQLDFIVRNSRFKQDATWSSSSYSLWESHPLIDFNTGVRLLASSSPDFKFSLAATGNEPNTKKLGITFTINGTSPSFTLEASDGYLESKTVIASDYFTLSDTGYKILFTHSIPGSLPFTSSFEYTAPYSLDIFGLANAIRSKRDFCSIISNGLVEYQNALLEPGPAEDTIAAFILCLDRLDG